MTYKTCIMELDKIKSPITVKHNDEVIEFCDGKQMTEYNWDKNLSVDSLELLNGNNVITLVENKGTDTSWCGEEEVSFF